MKAIFYRGKEYGSWFSKLICLWTRGPYSHSEIAFSKEAGIRYYTSCTEKQRRRLLQLSHKQISLHPKADLEDQIRDGVVTLCFSASEKDKCVRLKLIHLETFKWDEIEVDASIMLEQMLIRRCNEELCGKPYDYVGLFGFATPLEIIRPSKFKYWCSRTTMIVLWWGGFLKDEHGKRAHSPNSAFNCLAQRTKPLERIGT